MKKYFVIIPIIISFLSCEKDLKTDVSVTEKLCFNCVLNPDSLIHGSLTLSQSISENKTFAKIDHAIIELKKDGQTIAFMQNIGNGRYTLNTKPSTGGYYEIRIKAKGYPDLTASTIVPSKPEVKYELYNPVIHGTGYNSFMSYSITKHIIDQVGINRYWYYRLGLSKTNKLGFTWRYYDVESTLIDDFNKVTDSMDKLGFHYEYYLRINDLGLDGKTLSFEDIAYKNEINFFMDTDEHYDKYLKSTIKQKMNDGDLLFNEPVQIYSNIENGLGIFGSAAITSFKL